MLNRLEIYIEQLQADPASFLLTMTYVWGVILFSLIIHEIAHGYVALRCGDPTAKIMGRLSLNPARHLNPAGTLCMFLFGFGWANPVPVNPRNFKHFRRDDLLVSLAGITVNLCIFLAAVLLSCIVSRFLWTQEMMEIMREEFGEIDILLNPFYGWVLTFTDKELPISASCVINYGHEMIASFAEYMRTPWLIWVQRLLLLLAQINLTLALFNLLPIPPMDGFRVFNEILLKGRVQLNGMQFRIAQVVLIVLVLTGALNKVLSFCVTNVYTVVLRLFLLLTGQG